MGRVLTVGEAVAVELEALGLGAVTGFPGEITFQETWRAAHLGRTPWGSIVEVATLGFSLATAVSTVSSSLPASTNPGPATGIATLPMGATLRPATAGTSAR